MKYCQVVGDCYREADIDQIIGRNIDDLPIDKKDIPYIKEVVRETLRSGQSVRLVISIGGDKRIGITMRTNKSAAILRLFVPKN
ncbi:hypothetical protein DSCO28_50850 [Desulfosarcina ovata subsp. sediminis]|uniref:Uncharacterized protein n=1 Tax=Desulfosarcina ovata subsp. sediminis TaxID=885957 RepID=A0A5K7ZW90_9BACT|nr:hypothetical protein [Desulfosarcina ovata]BBO84519.1 hypothetical protein DSCO28_50850 [Desulfosarcina ovata subsp. sediminis]